MDPYPGTLKIRIRTPNERIRINHAGKKEDILEAKGVKLKSKIPQRLIKISSGTIIVLWVKSLPYI